MNADRFTGHYKCSASGAKSIYHGQHFFALMPGDLVDLPEWQRTPDAPAVRLFLGDRLEQFHAERTMYVVRQFVIDLIGVAGQGLGHPADGVVMF